MLIGTAAGHRDQLTEKVGQQGVALPEVSVGAFQQKWAS